MIDGHGLSFIKMSEHAKQRWIQRCSHLDALDELSTVRRANKQIINALRQGWEWSHGVGTWPAQHDYLVSPNGVVFIIGEAFGTPMVITVMRTKEIKQWRSQATVDDRLRRKHTQL